METHRLGADLSAQVGILSRLVMALADEGAAVIVMEQPFLPLNTGRGVTTSLQIREVAIRVETLAVAASLKVRFVPVNTWRAVVLGNGRMKTDAAKEAAVRYVESVYKQRPESHNQADAACLATWGASTVGLEIARRANVGGGDEVRNLVAKSRRWIVVRANGQRRLPNSETHVDVFDATSRGGY
jgi:hypothetical protein